MTIMEAGRSFVGQTPPLPLPAPSRFKTSGTCTFPATPTRRNFLPSVISPEPRDEIRPPFLKEDTSPEFMTSEEGSDGEDGDRFGTDFEQIGSLSSDNRTTLLGSSTSSSSLLDEVITVRSTKRLQRESVRRKVTIPGEMDPYYAGNEKPSENIFQSREIGPILKFLSNRQSKELLTKTEECKLAEDIQEFLRLEEVKNAFELKFGRQPTLTEWAEHVGLSCSALKDRHRRGCRSRKMLINSNLRMVVHIAKRYQGLGLGFADLLQEGNRGLVKSVDRFKPELGCRFSTYAYYWVRQSIQTAVHKHSRIIYLPLRFHVLLTKVKIAKKFCYFEGNYPTTEEIARRVGITPVVLTRLLHMTRFARLPTSLDRRVWVRWGVTYKDLVADPRTGDLLVSYAKLKMEQHLLELVKALPPRESRTLWLKYGLDNRRPKTLAAIGDIFGVTRERARQLHNRGLERLKESLSPEEKKAYVALWTGQL